MKLEYRAAHCGDAEQVHNVEIQCFATPWSLQSIKYDLCENPIAQYVVAADGQTVIGFCGVHLIVGEGHITNVAILPEYRGKGVGEKMLRTLICQICHIAQQYTLEVRASNLAAIRLYTKLGFETQGVREGYYTDTGEDALIMWRTDIQLT